ncbi:MAG: DUF5011 domain-containing protein [Bacteroidales bacterium]|nr:DUF5011 domain-containing protein [Bacteroidales bacterium]
MTKIWAVVFIVFVLIVSTQCKKEEEEKDTTPPVISLEGANPLSVDKGTAYVEPGFSASDDLDGDISSNVKVTGNVDVNTEGTYYLKYNVSDAAGNNADEQTRKVNVMIF